MTDHDHTNALIDETSPYLLQHAHNPVDWHPWGEGPLEEARQEDKPIFLSIGYSACHWCHVMERESFEDEEIAEFLNEHFVPIKVDREERPDLDRIYMNATQMLTGQGGWPMSVFLTPDLEPFYAGTYFPPDDKWGRPGFRTVLEHLAELWEDERGRVEEIGDQMSERLQDVASSEGPGGNLDATPLRNGLQYWKKQFDERHGGFGQSPKFPPSMQLRALLHAAEHEETSEEDSERAVEMVETTLARMASGGMYDQIGGGFHRYSVDDEWLVPHFEKMLYDNAMLTLAYVDGYRATGRTFYRRIVDETLEYVEREMTDREAEVGAPFYSTQDAESEGEEGKFFVWTPESLRDVLDEDEAERAEAYWDVTEAGNFENDWSIPNRLHALADEGIGAAFEEMPDDVAEIRQKLFEARQERVAPGTDTKVLASWNGLMIRAFAYAGFYLDEPDYIDRAAGAADFVLGEMVDGDLDGEFELMRTYKDDRARITGYLDDYAMLASGLAELFEATGARRWLARAERVADRMIELFADEDGGFYYTGDHHENLLVRDKDKIDNATPAGNSVAIDALLRLSLLSGRAGLRDRADAALREFFPRLQKSPQIAGEMMQGLDFHLGEPMEIVVVETESGEADPYREVLRETYLANAVRIQVDLSEASLEEWANDVPVVEGREPRDGAATVYVCRGGTCRQPATTPDELREQLGG